MSLKIRNLSVVKKLGGGLIGRSKNDTKCTSFTDNRRKNQRQRKDRQRQTSGKVIAGYCRYKGEERTHERNLIACFNDDVNKADSYSKINKLIDRFLLDGGFYPYEKLSFTGLEKCMGNAEKTAVYLRKM